MADTSLSGAWRSCDACGPAVIAVTVDWP